MLLPRRNELIFAGKTYSGAMLALALAFRLGLDNPYWSMATAFIVAQPMAGAMRSKAVYRFAGTALGGTAAVVLVPNLVDAPVLLCLALALWIGLCLYLSLLDRSPRAYLFMLAGYTAGIIGFPAVLDPQSIFITALTRVEEISIGIACTTVIGTVILPQPLGPVLAGRIASWFAPGVDWACAALAGERDDDATIAGRQRLAVEAVDIGMLTSQLAYDISPLASATGEIRRLRVYMLSLMPVLSSIADRVAQLRAADALTAPYQALLTAAQSWVRAGPAHATSDDLHGRIETLELASRHRADWDSLLRLSLLERLREMISLLAHARAIHNHVVLDAPAPDAAPLRGGYVANQPAPPDHALALLSAAAVTQATLLVCAFWIETGWSSGAGAAVIVAVACSFFAAQDDPAPAIMLMLRNAIYTVLGGGFYIFVILPRVETFGALYLALLPVGLIIGVLVSRPATFGTGMVPNVAGATGLALQNGYVGNFATFMNGALALIIGLAAAVTVTRLMRSLGAAYSAQRILQAGWRDIADAAAHPERYERGPLSGRMIDRLGQLMPRLAAAAAGADVSPAQVLLDLRVGLNVIELARVAPALSRPGAAACEAVLACIAAQYRTDPRADPPASLGAAIDRAITLIATDTAAPRRPTRLALTMLIGLRSVLVPAAPPPFALRQDAPALVS
jgi:uncharacterized membrane protein YccC